MAARAVSLNAEQDADALARFDELTAEQPRPVLRRMRQNAATAHGARLVAAIAGRDADALRGLLADDFEAEHHPTGAVYDREGPLLAWRALLAAERATFTVEPLATLGDWLALCRVRASSAGFTDSTLDVGAAGHESLSLAAVDARGQARRTEIFALDRLADAVVRLYERYADLLPDGPERIRAAATARSVAAVLAQGAELLDRWARAWARTVEHVDHRIVGFGTVHGAEEVRAAIGTLFELADDVTVRIDDVLGLRSDAFLTRRTNFGTERAGGGTFERRFLHLGVFGADGLVARFEVFEADRDAEALARFDEVTATRSGARLPTASERAGYP